MVGVDGMVAVLNLWVTRPEIWMIRCPESSIQIGKSTWHCT